MRKPVLLLRFTRFGRATTASIFSYFVVIVLQGLPQGSEHGDGVDVTLGLDRCQGLEVKEVVGAFPDLEIHLRMAIVGWLRGSFLSALVSRYTHAGACTLFLLAATSWEYGCDNCICVSRSNLKFVEVMHAF